MNSHEPETPASDTHNRTQVQQLPEGTSSDGVNSTSPNFGTFNGPSVPGYPFLSQPQASGEIGRLGNYRVLAKLGEGGMGFVFRAEDPVLKRFVALKVMRPEDAAKPLAADRFLREGRAAAGLKSDHIITIYQVGQANGAPFIAMEYLEGIVLDEWIKQQKKAVPVAQVVRVVRDTLRGLATAHDKGLIHRDIKPANLWIEKGTMRIKVLDFGLTRGADGNDQMTTAGAVVGTPAYMAPEQAAGRSVDPRADLFSVGTVMYQLFLGINPFVRSNMMATMGAISFDVPPPVVSLRPEVPQAYSDYLDRLLAKDPAGRPANAKAALAELAAIEKSLQDTAKTLASASGLPVVSMMAPAAAPVAAQVWGDITDSDDTVVQTNRSDPETPRKPPSKKLLIGSGLFAFFALILGGITIIIMKADPDRTAASWVIAQGGGVRADGADKDIKSAADLPKDRFTVTQANLGNTAVTDAGLERIKELKGLTCLNLFDTQVTDAGLVHLKNLKGLTQLSLHRTPVTNAGLKHLKDLKRLTWLNLEGTAVSDAGLANFKELKGLTGIDLSSTAVTDAGLVHLKELKGLMLLYLPDTKVSDAGLVHLKELKNLTGLSLDGTKVSDAGLVHLKELKNLTGLYVSNTAVTDAGLVHLQEIKLLTVLDLQKTKVTAAGVKKFRAALSECKVESDFPE